MGLLGEKTQTPQTIHNGWDCEYKTNTIGTAMENVVQP